MRITVSLAWVCVVAWVTTWSQVCVQLYDRIADRVTMNVLGLPFADISAMCLGSLVSTKSLHAEITVHSSHAMNGFCASLSLVCVVAWVTTWSHVYVQLYDRISFVHYPVTFLLF